ncbi:glycosyltransferase family 2 protein [Sulfurimonas sp.]|uniref:glycosyltransferase family 2 protein n=1 Tax=Sulfurimonas sp. TaxID=2022749 RepID=UPI003D107649
MNTEPTIAVLLATYNGEKFLKQQLDSIFEQTYTNIKIYICDDNSVDTTFSILQKYQKEYPKQIMLFKNEHNLGYVKNFEKLLNFSQEKYIAFCDQDDIWFKNKLELQIKEMLVLENAHKDTPCMVHSDLKMIDENNNILEKSYFEYRSYKLKQNKDLGHILGPNGVMGNTMLFNEKLKALVLPFPEKLDLHDYWVSVNNELFGIRRTIYDPLVKYRIHTYNISNSKKTLQKQQSIFFNRNIKLPNIETTRKFFLTQLLQDVESNDKKILETYLNYLNFRGNRFNIYFSLLKFSLIKRDILIRINIFFKILLTTRYKSKV